MIEEVQDSQYQPVGRRLRRTKVGSFKDSISTLNKSAQVTSTLHLESSSKECRICLDNETSSLNELVAPCKCTGSVKYVHDNCFKKWIERQFSQKNKKQQGQLLKKGIECQLCKVKLTIIFTNKYTCCQCTKFNQKYQQNRLVFYLFLLFFVVNFGFMGFLIYNTNKSPLNFKSQAMTALVIIIAFIFLGLTALLTVYYFLKDYIIEKVFVLSGYEQRKESKRYSRNQIIPLQSQ